MPQLYDDGLPPPHTHKKVHWLAISMKINTNYMPDNFASFETRGTSISNFMFWLLKHFGCWTYHWYCRTVTAHTRCVFLPSSFGACLQGVGQSSMASNQHLSSQAVHPDPLWCLSKWKLLGVQQQRLWRPGLWSHGEILWGGGVGGLAIVMYRGAD